MKVFSCTSHISSCSKSVCGQRLPVQRAGLKYLHYGGKFHGAYGLSCVPFTFRTAVQKAWGLLVWCEERSS